MLLLLIVVPCTLVAVGIVVVLDRTGVLPGLDRPAPVSSRPVHSVRPGGALWSAPASSRPVRSIARPASLVTILILATWILAWLVVLGVGLNIILASS